MHAYIFVFNDPVFCSSLSDKFRALFTLKNAGGNQAIDWICKGETFFIFPSDVRCLCLLYSKLLFWFQHICMS